MLAPGAAERAGLKLQPVSARPVAETIRANAETQFVPSRLARVAPRIAGTVREVKAALGQEVDAGAVLAVIESVELGEAKSQLLQSDAIVELRLKTWEQEQLLAGKGITSGREALQAKTDLEEARLARQRAVQKLLSFGLSQAQVDGVAAKRDVAPLLDVTAPFQGTVVEASAVPGELGGPDRPLYTVAAVDRLWISVDVYEIDLPRTALDQKVLFTVEGLPGRKFPGKVVAIGGAVDDRTRTVPVFAEIKNVQGLLRARMFGRAEITVKTAEPKLLVPKEAVQSDNDCLLVFVSPVKDVYQARKIQVGTVYEGGYEILAGLAEGEKIVPTGSSLLKTQALRGELAAG